MQRYGNGMADRVTSGAVLPPLCPIVIERVSSTNDIIRRRVKMPEDQAKGCGLG